MKASRIVALAITVTALHLISAPRTMAQITSNFCTDCAERIVTTNDAVHWEAMCCVAVNDGYCNETPPYYVQQANVGVNCKINITQNGTQCAPAHVDQGCSTSGGGNGDFGGFGGGFGGGDDGCTTRTGYCPPSCGSCTFLF